MEYTVKELEKLWQVDRRTVMRWVKKRGYHTEKREVEVNQKQIVMFIEIGDEL